MSSFLTFFTICFTVCNFSYSANDSLIFVQTVSRHGGRSPMKQYESSNYNESQWFQGFGHLTQIGRRQAEKLGLFLKERYIPGFFKQQYDHKELYVRSTDIDRTLLTARLSMDAMFPTSGDVINPLPVHTTPVKDDYMLYTECRAWNERVNEKYVRDEMRKISEKYERFVARLTHFIRKLDNYGDVLNLADGVICTSANNYSLPSWIEGTNIQDELIDYFNAYFDVAFNRYDNGRLLAGTLLGYLIDNMDKKIRDPTFQWKGRFYYAHDTTLAPLLAALKVFNRKQPPFTSTIIMELYRRKDAQNATDADYYVNVLYRNDSTKPPVPLELPGCKVDCPLDTFKSLTKDNVVVDWKKVCLKEKKMPLRDILLLVTSSLLLLCVIIIIIMGIVCCKTSPNLHRYVNVPTDIE